MNKNLIPVFSGQISNSQTLLCDARKLHEFLQIKSKFATWISRRIEEYGFIENQDFLVSQIWDTKNSGRGGNRKAVSEYHLTLDMAKELAMVERNEQGRAARRYFIECEKRLHENRQPEQKTPPAVIKRRIKNRDDLSFTRRDGKGNLLNWFPPSDQDGGYDWYEAYAVGEAWFAEVAELAANNPEEAWYALKLSAASMSAYPYYHPEKQHGSGHIEGYFDRLARYALAGLLTFPNGVRFPFIREATDQKADLSAYLKNAESLPDEELRWRAWTMSEKCRRRCYEQQLERLLSHR